MAQGSQDLDAIGVLLRDVRHVPVPSREEQRQLAQAVAAGDGVAREAMLVANLRLVVKWAQAFSGQGVEAADLVQEGFFGLARAVDKFRWEKGYQFSTYATWWIRQAMQRAVEAHHTIHLPQDVVEVRSKLERDAPVLERELGRVPTAEELCDLLVVKPALLERAAGAAVVTASLDQPLRLDGYDVALGDVVGADDDGPAAVEDGLVDAGLRAVVDGLPEPDRTVVRMRFGFDTGEPASYTAIGKRLHLSLRTVARCEKRALEALGGDSTVAAARAA